MDNSNNNNNNNSSNNSESSKKRAPLTNRNVNINVDDDNSNNRHDKRHNSVTDDLICPITCELPIDPVMAEDGRIYERSAIEQHFKMHQGTTLKSPFTNKPMGLRLLPAPQIKSHVETLIEKHMIEGDLRDAWKKREAEKQDMEELLGKACGGDASAMYSVFVYYYFHGNHGFPKDYALAYKWVKKAHEAGAGVFATACLGSFLLTGKVGDHDIHKNVTMGIALTTMAAERGSDAAACHLGSAFADGLYGLEVDHSLAIHWLNRCLSGDCQYKHMTKSYLEETKTKLEEVLNRENESSTSS